MPDDRYRAAYEAAVEEVDALLVQLADRKQFANMLAQRAGLEPPYRDTAAPAVGGAVKIRADQFANYSAPSVAARAFLEWRGQPKGSATIDEIFDALEAGGFSFGSKSNEAKGGLRIALAKDEKVKKLPNNTYGLWAWYPDAKRERLRSKKNGSDDSDAPSSDDDIGPTDADESNEAQQ